MTTTWTDLDRANAAHYAAKARPDWLTDAIAASRAADHACAEYVALCERRGEYDPGELADLTGTANDAYAWMMDCLSAWHTNCTPYSLQLESAARVAAEY